MIQVRLLALVGLLVAIAGVLYKALTILSHIAILRNYNLSCWGQLSLSSRTTPVRSQ
jgi:hypothetical protein